MTNIFRVGVFSALAIGLGFGGVVTLAEAANKTVDSAPALTVSDVDNEIRNYLLNHPELGVDPTVVSPGAI